jgi:hypothetical protein
MRFGGYSIYLQSRLLHKQQNPSLLLNTLHNNSGVQSVRSEITYIIGTNVHIKNLFKIGAAYGCSPVFVE